MTTPIPEKDRQGRTIHHTTVMTEVYWVDTDPEYPAGAEEVRVALSELAGDCLRYAHKDDSEIRQLIQVWDAR